MVEKINTYQFSKKFKKEYNKLPIKIQKKFDEKLSLFLNNMAHPSLIVKRIKGIKDRWEGSVTKDYRFTFQFAGDSIVFRTIGTHDILKRTSWD